jgi:hypothetical protein
VTDEPTKLGNARAPRRDGRSGIGVLGLWLVLVSSAWPALRGGDEHAAAAIWRAAQELPGEDASARIYVDAARVNNEVAPWQGSYPEARARVWAVAAARRAVLPHDRGGVRRKLVVELEE